MEITLHSIKIDHLALYNTDIGHLQPQDVSHDEKLTFPKSNCFLDDPE